MKRIFSNLMAALLLLVFMAPSMVTWGQNRGTYSYTFTSNAWTQNGTATLEGVNWTLNMSGGTISNFDNDKGMHFGTNNSPCNSVSISTNELSGTISSVTVEASRGSSLVGTLAITVGDDAFYCGNSTTNALTTTNTAYEFTGSATGEIDILWTKTSGKGAYYIKKITVEYTTSSNEPSISADNVDIEYNATSGTINYTINNSVNGGVLTASTTAEWLTLGTVGTTVPFTCSANQTAGSRTATVALTYTYNTNQTVTKNVTITQAGNPNATDNISDITAAGTYTVQGTIVAKSTRGFIVGDGTGYAYYYNQNYTQADYNIGDMVKLSGSVVVYGGVFEFNSSTTITAATSSNYVAEDPTVLTGEDMEARVASTTPPQLSNYVQYEGTLTVDGTHYNITDISGATNAIGSLSYPTSTDFTSLNGKQVTVTGYYVGISTGTYYNTMLGSIEEVLSDNPSISADNVSVEYNATSGTITYTINNPVSGGVLTASTTAEWLTIGTVGTTVPFTCSANQTAGSRTATVTLTYTYNRATVTKDVTVTQTGDPNSTMTIAQVRAQGTGDVTTVGTVTSFSVNNSNKTTAYMQDATAAIVVFGEFTVAVGDEIRVAGTLSTYNGLLEIGSSNSNPTVTVISSGNTVTPTLMTIAEINASTNQGWYIRIEEATVTAINNQNTTIAQGDNSIVVRGISGVDYSVNDIISLDGNIGYYNGNQIANPTNVTVQQNTEPSITIATSTVNAPAAGETGTLEVTYANIDEITANVYFCDAEGAEATYDWITAEMNDDDNLDYTISANEGEARTAYLMVNVGDVYSNLVTINQAQYVVDYATLPFEFDGGRADIANTNGLTQNGLDSDYSNSPKLKFKTTGTWVLLHFNEVPGTLTYTIKGNSFSGGTFTVQTSEDGVTYTDLQTYTQFGETGNTAFNESFENIGTNVRYIKWIYVEKSSGNVALGDIVLYEEGGGPVIETYDLTVEPVENLEIFTFIGDDLTEPLEGAGTLQVQEGTNVMLSVSANEGYILQSLIVDGVNHVNDIEDLTYSFTMPGHNVTISATAVEDVPFEPATYTLATTIESGKTYIIVGSKTIEEETYYYAMGEQRNNNRAGVAISMDGTTATVETADVHEFVITALEEEGFYSIYDNGYLYAAGSSSNYLRTNDSLDVDGQWEISFDTLCHIVASHSDNRNVMQFNYNGGSPLFSCYAPTTTTMAPVALYVKDETTTNQTETVALVAGANWFSTNLEITLAELQDALVAAVGTGNGNIVIKAKTQTRTYNGSSWRGNLTWDVARMYLINVPVDCEITLTGMPVNPEDHPVTIVPGTNWIAFPLNESMQPADAFANFAVTNDVVKSKNGSTKRLANGNWRGTNFPALEPWKGYYYNSAATTNRTLVFPTQQK